MHYLGKLTVLHHFGSDVTHCIPWINQYRKFLVRNSTFNLHNQILIISLLIFKGCINLVDNFANFLLSPQQLPLILQNKGALIKNFVNTEFGVLLFLDSFI